jgi:serine O-acetyltransferase
MLANLRRDAARLAENAPGKSSFRAVVEGLLFDNGFQAVVLYRLARWFKVRRIPFFGPAFARLNLFLTGVEISPSAAIGPGLRIAHGVGLVIGGYAKVGADALLLHGVTLGSPSPERVEEMPLLEDRVFVGAGAAIIGRVIIGAGSIIGVNAVVTRSVPPASRVLTRAGIDVAPLAPPPG